MRIERHYYTEDKKRWEEAEAAMSLRYDNMTAEERKAEMQFYTQSFNALAAECNAKFAQIEHVPNPEKARRFAAYRDRAIYMAEYINANLVAEDDEMRGVLDFETDCITVNDRIDELMLSSLGSLIVQADRVCAEPVNGLLHLRLTYILYDEISV